MLYKELQAARQKYLLVLFGFVLVGMATATLLNPSRTASNNSIFHSWAIGALFLTIGAAILTGADSIAEENGKNTLSFLLTRPISRTNIYAVKYLVNAAYLGAVLLTTSLLMFLAEQQTQRYKSGWTPPGSETIYNFVYVDKMPANEAFTWIVVILGIGLAVLALTALVSIFTSSALQAIISTLLLLTVPFGLIIFIDGFLNSQVVNKIYVFFLNLGLCGGLVLLGIAAGLYMVGLKVFKVREF